MAAGWPRSRGDIIRLGPMANPFDAVLLISFGGPQGLDEIRPFLHNVLRGRRIPETRFEAVVRHYEQFEGVSPLTPITMRQAAGLRARLEADGPSIPTYVGMRNWHPFLEDTLASMARAGVKRALALTLTAQHSYSSCGQYRQNVLQARQQLRASGQSDIEFTYISGWHDHPDFVRANARHIERALGELDPAVRDGARVVFTAHSIPRPMAAASRYEAELRESAVLVMRELERTDWAVVYQSRSGRPQDPWLEPDVCDYLRIERARGLEAAVICPLGFVADHIEVLYDLDHEAAETCAEIGLPMTRAAAVNDHPLFLDMLADVVRDSCRRYGGGRPLQIAPAVPSPLTEPPPPRTEVGTPQD